MNPHSLPINLCHLDLSWERFPSSLSFSTEESPPCSQAAESPQARSPQWEYPGCERSGRADRSRSPLETGPSWSPGAKKKQPVPTLPLALCPISFCKILSADQDSLGSGCETHQGLSPAPLHGPRTPETDSQPDPYPSSSPVSHHFLLQASTLPTYLPRLC